MARLSGLVRRRRMVLSTLGLAETMPAALRPSLVIQRRAISNGLLGDSVFWKIVAVALFLRGPLEGTFGRKSERLARYGVGPGHSVRGEHDQTAHAQAAQGHGHHQEGAAGQGAGRAGRSELPAVTIES